MSSHARPAFYALAPGGWRDYVTVLHPPYTAWHLSYVAIGAALTSEFSLPRLAATLAAFLLAVGVGAHALDELHGRPLRTKIPSAALVALAVISIGAAVAIGVAGALVYDLWLLPFVAAGAFVAVAYNLELLGGRVHGDLWFAVAWGAFPLLTGYFSAAWTLSPEAVLAACAAALLSLAQRHLSTQVRTVRRRVAAVSGTVVYRDGHEEPVDADTLVRRPEAALRAVAAAVVLFAAALVVLRLS